MINFINRPLTPHLLIYKPQSSSILSIWHRISGVILILNCICISCILKLNIYLILFVHVNYSYIFLLLNLVMYYHICNGFRNILINFNYL